MLLQKETNPALNTVTAYGDDYIEINKTRHTHSIYFRPEGEIHALEIQKPHRFYYRDSTKAHWRTRGRKDPMAFLDGRNQSLENPEQIEVVLIGTGAKQQFLPAAVTGDLLTLGIGVEVMDSQAAARTYNILMSEGRRVVAALLL